MNKEVLVLITYIVRSFFTKEEAAVLFKRNLVLFYRCWLGLKERRKMYMPALLPSRRQGQEGLTGSPETGGGCGTIKKPSPS